MSQSETDEGLFNDFLEESEEMVVMVEAASTQLESNPADLEPIHEIFRGVHSLKGMGSFFNLTNLKEFCHDFESFLGLVRDKQIEVNHDLILFILEGADHLKAIFHRMRAVRTDVELTPPEDEYLEKIEEKVSGGSEKGKYDRLRIELLKYFNRARDDGAFDDDAPAKEIHDIITRVVPDLVVDRRKTVAASSSRWLRGEMEVTREYNDIKMVIDVSMAGGKPEDAHKIFTSNLDALIERHAGANDVEAEKILRDIKENFDIFYQDELGIDDMLASVVSNSLNDYAALLAEIKPATKAEKVDSSAPAGSDGGGKASAVKAKTVRVRETLLDEFMDQMGELITINELFNILQRRLEGNQTDGLSTDMKNANQAFSELSNLMQKSLYEVRKAPLERALSKLPSIVRGIAKNAGKEIKLAATGGDAEVDKSLLEKIEMILIHCVRNSSDHGIESVEDRKKAGKPSEGRISIDVCSDKSTLFMRISDDGRGVDVAAVKRKAVEKGIISHDTASRLPDADALNILLRPGFSTAEQVTETSGRGVGLDVLQANVSGMGGSFRLTNDPGKGLAIDISLPLAYTTSIKLGLMLDIGGKAFLIPVENVRETFKAAQPEVTTVEGRGEVISRWGLLYPAVRLSHMFGIKPRSANIWDGVCVLAESKGTRVCLVVDEMLGQRQIVYKQLTVTTRQPTAFDGVSILDGRRMALILSVEGVIKQFQE
ncbi:MAG: chemotaxis protein CheA [Nitrospinae bacterium]|nr:chemotaxis protein CheA [Nitrospinota bacterium]